MSELITTVSKGIKSGLREHFVSAHSLVHCGVFHSFQATRFSQSVVGSEIIDSDGPILVERLFFPSSPSAIRWPITKIVINALNSVIWGRGLTHVLDKVLETIFPSAADSNSALGVVGVGWVFAARIHVAPNNVSTSSRLPMSTVAFSGFSGFFTSTAGALSASEIASLNRFFNAAFTFANPFKMVCFAFLRRLFFNCPKSEFLSC